MILNSTYIGSVSLGVSWAPEAEAEYYKVYYNHSPNITEDSILAGQVDSFLTFVIVNLPSEITQYIKIFAYDSDDNLLSSSNEISLTTLAFSALNPDDPPFSIQSNIDIQNYISGQEIIELSINSNADLYYRATNDSEVLKKPNPADVYDPEDNPTGETLLYEEPFPIPIQEIEYDSDGYLVHNTSTIPYCYIKLLPDANHIEENITTINKDFVYPPLSNINPEDLAETDINDYLILSASMGSSYKVMYRLNNTDPFEEWNDILITENFIAKIEAYQVNKTNSNEKSAETKFNYVMPPTEEVPPPIEPEIKELIVKINDENYDIPEDKIIVCNKKDIIEFQAIVEGSNSPTYPMSFLWGTPMLSDPEGMLIKFKVYPSIHSGPYVLTCSNIEGVDVSETYTLMVNE